MSVLFKGVICFVTEKFGGRLMSDSSVERKIVANPTSAHGLYSKGQPTSGTAQFAA
jgi:hypothetical protein